MFLIILKLNRYVTDPYKTQQMCDKTVLENGGIFKSVLDCYKNQEIYNKCVIKQLIITLMH